MSTILDFSAMMNTCWGDEAFGCVPPPIKNNIDIEVLKRALNIGVPTNNMRSTAQMIKEINNNKMYWGKSLDTIAETGEELVKCMENCSEQMKAIAQKRDAVKNEPAAASYIEYLAGATREWTKMRSNYAEEYLESDLAATKDISIREMQSEMDAAKMAHDWETYNFLRPEIENLRDERARYEKWSRDNKKMK